MNFFLITYDIPDDKRRTKTAHLLQDYGERVQFSVFEVWLDPVMRRDLLARLETLIVAEEDTVRIYQLCAACQKQVVAFGLGHTPEPPQVVII